MRSVHLVVLSAMLALFVVAAQPPASAEAFTGHGCSKATCLYFTSSKKPTGYYFKRCDSAWRNVSRTYLQGFQTAEALLASYPSKTLHSECSTNSPSPSTGAPVASFNVTVTDQKKATFTNTSTGTGNTYFWDFGDGYTSTATSPYHYYKPGNYVVSLTATNAKGADTYTRQIDMGVTPESPAPLT